MTKWAAIFLSVAFASMAGCTAFETWAMNDAKLRLYQMQVQHDH